MGGPIAILTLICPNKEAGMANARNTNKVRTMRIGILLPIVLRLPDFAEPIGAARIERRHVSRENKVICVWQVVLAHFGRLIWPTPWNVVFKRVVFGSAGA